MHESQRLCVQLAKQFMGKSNILSTTAWPITNNRCVWVSSLNESHRWCLRIKFLGFSLPSRKFIAALSSVGFDLTTAVTYRFTATLLEALPSGQQKEEIHMEEKPKWIKEFSELFHGCPTYWIPVYKFSFYKKELCCLDLGGLWQPARFPNEVEVIIKCFTYEKHRGCSVLFGPLTLILIISKCKHAQISSRWNFLLDIRHKRKKNKQRTVTAVIWWSFFLNISNSIPQQSVFYARDLDRKIAVLVWWKSCLSS